MPDWREIVARLPGGHSNDEAVSTAPVGGGCINAGWRVDCGDRRFFVKTNQSSLLAMFEAEMDGLAEMRGAGGVRVPEPFATGVCGDEAWIAMEWIQPGPANATSDAVMGEGLAQMHRATRGEFGWHRDNTIGSTPQRNDTAQDWPAFFARHRLRYQLDLAQANGWSGGLRDRGLLLAERTGSFFTDYRPSPSLLHGDLWAGNKGTDEQGAPYIFDPAVYYGDRETDLAMTRLFGGFGRAFYDAYESAWSLAPGHRERNDLYQLYHVLNHLNLFGSGYLGRAQDLIQRLLRG